MEPPCREPLRLALPHEACSPVRVFREQGGWVPPAKVERVAGGEAAGFCESSLPDQLKHVRLGDLTIRLSGRCFILRSPFIIDR